MRPHLSQVLLLLPLIVLLSIFVDERQAVLAADKSNGWIQKRFDGSKGKFTIYITDDANCTRNEDADYAVVQRPKVRELVMYSDKRKNYYTLSAGDGLKHTSGLALMKLISTSTAPLTWQPAYKSQYMGHPIEVWRATQGGSPISKSASDRFDGYEFWAASDIHIQPEFVKLGRSAHGWPNTNALPLRYLRVYPSGRPPRELASTTELKRGYIPPSTFTVPKSYKKAGSELEVASDTHNLKDMMQEWDLTDKPISKAAASNR
jgi:hypothetical protein